MLKKLALILFTFTLYNSSALGILNSLQVKLENKCTASILNKGFLLKKSLIEIIKNHEEACGMPFTKRVLEGCPNLSCMEYRDLYSEYKSNNSDKVIGR